MTSYTAPSAHSYAHIMSVQRKAGNVTRVLELLEEMVQQGLTPTTTHYSYALMACDQHREEPNSLPIALSVYEQMRARGLRRETDPP